MKSSSLNSGALWKRQQCRRMSQKRPFKLSQYKVKLLKFIYKIGCKSLVIRKPTLNVFLYLYYSSFFSFYPFKIVLVIQNFLLRLFHFHISFFIQSITQSNDNKVKIKNEKYLLEYQYSKVRCYS